MILKAVLIIGIMVIWICLGLRVSDFGFFDLFRISDFTLLFEIMYASSQQQGTVWSKNVKTETIGFGFRYSNFGFQSPL